MPLTADGANPTLTPADLLRPELADPFLEAFHRAQSLLGLYEVGKDHFRAARLARFQTIVKRACESPGPIEGGGEGDRTPKPAEEIRVQSAQAERLADHTADAARVASLCGALVLAHAAIEHLLWQLLDRVTQEDSRRFSDTVAADRKVSLAELVRDGESVVVERARAAWIASIERAPLVKKLKLLAELQANGLTSVFHRFKAESLLERLDTLRNEAAHKQTVLFANENVPSLLDEVFEFGTSMIVHHELRRVASDRTAVGD